MKKTLIIILMAMLIFTGCNIKTSEEKVSDSGIKENSTKEAVKLEESLDDKIEKKISSMTIEEKVGELLMPSIDTVNTNGEKIDFTMITPEVE
ncbi:MAG TPA: hypothetical protein DCL31_18925, partial [Clostridium sp.]|nr:hypothetical protein [Clostridium sp.]